MCLRHQKLENMARIKIKSVGWVSLGDDLARDIKKDWEDTNVARTELVEIGEYTIPLSDLTAFAIPKVKKNAEIKLMSDEELAEFNLSLQKYKVTKTLSSGEEITFIEWERWLVDQGPTLS